MNLWHRCNGNEFGMGFQLVSSNNFLPWEKMTSNSVGHDCSVRWDTILGRRKQSRPRT